MYKINNRVVEAHQQQFNSVAVPREPRVLPHHEKSVGAKIKWRERQRGIEDNKAR